MKIYNYFTKKGCNIEVVHGYSIGGCAAIGLLSKLEASQKQSMLNYNEKRPNYQRNNTMINNVKILIVDRSFSSIGNVSLRLFQMAIQFGPTLHKLAKIVFTFENENMSTQFAELKSNKLMIWDHQD